MVFFDPWAPIRFFTWNMGTNSEAKFLTYPESIKSAWFNPIIFQFLKMYSFQASRVFLEGRQAVWIAQKTEPLGCRVHLFLTWLVVGILLHIKGEDHFPISCNCSCNYWFISIFLIWVFPKIGGNTPKWMVKIMENPYFLMDDLGGKPTI